MKNTTNFFTLTFVGRNSISPIVIISDCRERLLCFVHGTNFLMKEGIVTWQRKKL